MLAFLELAHAGKRPWPFRLILWLVDLTAMVYSHVLFATPFFGHSFSMLSVKE